MGTAGRRMKRRDPCGGLSLAPILKILFCSQLAQLVQLAHPLSFEGSSATICCHSVCPWGVCVSLLTQASSSMIPPKPMGFFGWDEWGEPTGTILSGTDTKFSYLSKKRNLLVDVSSIDSGLAGSRGNLLFSPSWPCFPWSTSSLLSRLCPHGTR